MRVKAPTKPPRSIRYLLCADRRLQRLSLRRISVRVKKAKKPTRSTRSKNLTRAKDPIRGRAINPRAMLLGLICIMAAAGLIAARQPSQRADVARIGAPRETIAPLEAIAAPEQAAVPARPETKKTVASKSPATTAVARTPTADASIGKTPAVESVRVTAVEPVPSPARVEATTPKAAPVESTQEVAVQNVMSVTITGCLANDEETFWLKDTSGTDAPRSRSWRSGFLKKRPATIELLDATNTLKLPSHVGQRVAATGTLINHEMRAHSLQRVAASCS